MSWKNTIIYYLSNSLNSEVIMEKITAICLPLAIVFGCLIAARYCGDMGVLFWMGITMLSSGFIGLAWLGINATMEN